MTLDWWEFRTAMVMMQIVLLLPAFCTAASCPCCWLLLPCGKLNTNTTATAGGRSVLISVLTLIVCCILGGRGNFFSHFFMAVSEWHQQTSISTKQSPWLLWVNDVTKPASHQNRRSDSCPAQFWQQRVFFCDDFLMKASEFRGWNNRVKR